jgi:hypothetical protein
MVPYYYAKWLQYYNTQPFSAFLLLVVDNDETKGSPAEVKEETWTNYSKKL